MSRAARNGGARTRPRRSRELQTVTSNELYLKNYNNSANSKNKNISINIVFLCGSVVEHCVNSAKGCGFDSQGTHILMKNV